MLHLKLRLLYSIYDVNHRIEVTVISSIEKQSLLALFIWYDWMEVV